MSIRFTKYIDINSVVGAAAQVAQRQWCARVFTTNPLVGPSAVLQFASPDDVGEFFGTTSEEYARALAYFLYQSPLGTAPTAIQFARFVAANQPATIYGEAAIASLQKLNAISAGELSLQFGSTVVNVTGINLSSAATLAAVATAVQTALVAEASQAPNGELANATVTWNATEQAFDFSASPTVTATETFKVLTPTGATPTTDVAAALGWYVSQGALVNDAALLETRVAGFSRVVELNDNFGSFCYTDASSITLSDATAVAQANAALNVMFVYRQYVSPTNWNTWSAALIGIAGVGLEYEDPGITAGNGQPRQFIEMLPASIQAAINFNAINGAVGFMYKQSQAFTPSVTTDALSDSLDAARVNYYGQTQKAGQSLSFYQTGVLCGSATSPIDSTVFVNEQWFKDEIASELMNLQLSVGQVPANKRGQNQLDAAIIGQEATNGNQASGVQAALRNGVISANSSLTMAQQIYITNQTNDSTAWQQVQTQGYWLGSYISSAVVNSVTVYTYNYTLIYRKDDVIKKIVGSHQLI
jgi:hypothetical protein